MDLPSLAIIFRGALSPNPDERKAAKDSLNQVQYTPEHLLRLQEIMVDENFDIAVRHVASIHFKNFIRKYWAPLDPGGQMRIMPCDKTVVRQNILILIPQVPQLLRAQLGESLRTMIRADYPEKWPGLWQWMTQRLNPPNQQVFGALYVLWSLTINLVKTPVNHQIVEGTFPHLLNIFDSLVQIANPSIEVADLIRLICKIFWSSIYLEIPKHLFDPNVFNAWMVLFLNILERPVPLEDQPDDPDMRKSWGWWKVKKRIVLILKQLYTRFGDKKPFAQMIQKNYAVKVLECYLKVLDVIRVGGYLPDRVINPILQYLSNSISKNSLYSILQSKLDVVLFEIIFPLMCFSDYDQKLWDEDPHEYVRKGYDSPSAAAMDFVIELVRKRGKENVPKFVLFIVGILKRYDEAAPEYKYYRQKDGALLAIGTLCDKLKQTEPCKSKLEGMLVRHVFPEFRSPMGHLRSKAAWVAGQYADIDFSDPNIFQSALHSVVNGMCDSELPVRVDSVFALRSFVEACKEFDEIRPILPLLLDEFFKLMNEVENEDPMVTLLTILDKFGEDMAPHALELCQNLAATFWKYYPLAAVGCLRAISTILKSASSLPELFVQIEPTLLPIMVRMLTTGVRVVFEEILEIVSYMTFFSPTVSLDMWSLWPLLIESLADWAIDFFPNILVPLDNYISRSTIHFLACKEPDYQQSLWNMISSILRDKNLEDSDTEPAPKLIQVVFQNCRGQVDHWVETYIGVTIERLRRTEKPPLKCLLIEVIADAFYYNATLTLSILQKLGVTTDIFTLWSQMLQQKKKSGIRSNFKREHDKKVCCLGLTSLLPLPANQLPAEALEQIFKAALELLVAYKEQLEEKDEDADDMDGMSTDDEDDNDTSDKDMGMDDGDGDEVDSAKLRKLASQAKTFCSVDDEDEDEDDSDNDFSDDEELQSPIDEVDLFVFFVDTVKVLQASDLLRFQSLTQTLDFAYQALANGVAQHAEKRRVEIEKEKLLEKASSADVAAP